MANGATTKMARLRGRSPRGERCRAAVPHGHWKTMTLVAGLRLDRLSAPMLIDSARSPPPPCTKKHRGALRARSST